MAPLAKNLVVSYDEFLKIKEQSKEILEYIDGVICMSPSPSTKHQRISSKLHAKLPVWQFDK